MAAPEIEQKAKRVWLKSIKKLNLIKKNQEELWSGAF
jgi:hypothetical protein